MYTFLSLITGDAGIAKTPELSCLVYQGHFPFIFVVAVTCFFGDDNGLHVVAICALCFLHDDNEDD